MSRKISTSHFGCEVVPVCGTFGAGTPVKKSQKVTFMSKKISKCHALHKIQKESQGEKSQKVTFLSKKISKSLSISGGTYLRYILTIGWGLVAVHLGSRVGSSCGTFGQ